MDARNRTCKGNLYVALFYLEKRATKTYYFNHYQEHAIKDSKKNFQFTSAWSLLHSRRLRYIHLIDVNKYILSWLCYVHQNWYISKEHQLLEINIKNHVIVIRDNVVWETNIPPHFSTRSGRSRSRSCYNSRLFTAISSSSTPCKKLMSLKIF